MSFWGMSGGAIWCGGGTLCVVCLEPWPEVPTRQPGPHHRLHLHTQSGMGHLTSGICRTGLLVPAELLIRGRGCL